MGARTGTSPEVIARLNEVATRALARPDAVDRMSGMGIETRPVTPGEFTAFIRAETKKWGEIIRRSGARAE